jgi:hypothetical protein
MHADDADPIIDWSSIEEVSSHVSRATLSGMQQLWKQHASAMDAEGKTFAQQIYSMHLQAIKVSSILRNINNLFSQSR